jgi:DNA polymerase mu
MSAAEIVREWIGLKPDLDTKIPRLEVGEIERCVAAELEALMTGCRYTVTGGYRRGKPESNDVDVVICPPRDEVDEGRLLRDLVTRMTDLGEFAVLLCPLR